jgi:hypothetical protein
MAAELSAGPCLRVARSCLWALAKSACLAKNSSCLSSALDKSKAKISLEWAYFIMGYDAFL